jgi:hypothetical protein
VLDGTAGVVASALVLFDLVVRLLTSYLDKFPRRQILGLRRSAALHKGFGYPGAKEYGKSRVRTAEANLSAFSDALPPV